MKCISYISKAASMQNGVSVPRNLSEIFSTARKKNPELDISGILSYRDGYYIQVLEGPASSVDHIYGKIKEDKRHTDLVLLLETSITERSFANWSMKLLQSVRKDPTFVKFMSQHTAALSSLNKNAQELLKPFYSGDIAKYGKVETYIGKTLRLLAWPDLTVVKPSPVVIELCARLTKSPHAYNELLMSNDFGTRQQLDKILNKFDSLEILQIRETKPEDANIAPPVEVKKPREENSFYSKMKSFLGRL